MSEKWPDHTKMTDAEFVDLSRPYFRKPMITLHEGLCLFHKYNPEEREEVGINLDTDQDSTARPYMYALDALKNPREVKFDFHGDIYTYKFEVLKENPNFNEGKRYSVRTRAFVAWIIETWPPSSHFQLAEFAYRDAKLEKSKKKKWLKGSAKQTSDTIWKYTIQYFLTEKDIDPSNPAMKASSWADEIKSLIDLDYEGFPDEQTIRKAFKNMVDSGDWDDLVKEVEKQREITKF